MTVFFNSEGRLRNGWWIAIFFLVLATLLAPPLLLTKSRGSPLAIETQAVIVVLASFICQAFRRRPMTELTGRFDLRWVGQLAAGCFAGAALMLIPAAGLGAFGAITWTRSDAGISLVAAAIPLVIAVAVTEELIFRGFVFQRLIEGIGAWPAQIILGAYFVLSHSDGLANAGSVRSLATANIFIASILFGLAYLRTRSLALPFGMHFAANFTQGTILGFGVSGSRERGLLIPHYASSAEWLTGGAFGLEASLPGIITVIAATVILFFWHRSDGRSSGFRREVER